MNNNDKTLLFYEKLTEGMFPRTSPSPSFKWIGCVAYLRGRAGVFKLERSGGHDSFMGLEGTYTSDVGAKDHITFAFADFLKPDVARASNKQLAEERAVYAWRDSRDNQYEWYCAPPLTLAPLHDAIKAWLRIWNEGRS